MEDLRNNPFSVIRFDSDKWSEFNNRDVSDWLQKEDIAFIRSRPAKKTDQGTVGSKNSHAVRVQAFC